MADHTIPRTCDTGDVLNTSTYTSISFQMIPSHIPQSSERYQRLRTGRKIADDTSNLRCRLCVRLGSRFAKRFLLVAICIAVILFISSLDPGGIEDNGFTPWDWGGMDMASWLGNMSLRMSNRRQHLHEQCQLTGLNLRGNDSLHRPNPWEFLVNRRHHLVWCNVFKAASTSWMYNFNILAGYEPRYLQMSKQVPLQLARKRYLRPSLETLLVAQNDSVSFLIVRHPFERLLSGYRDKIEHALAHSYHQKLNNFIISKYRRTPTGKVLKRGRRKVPTFSEFVDYVTDLHREGKEFDMHWTPINGFCTPCQVHFDIIMKFETLEEDQNYLIYGQKLETWIRPQWKNPSKGRSKTINLTRDYYSQLTCHQIYQLHEIYRHDFQLFNYTVDNYLQMALDASECS